MQRAALEHIEVMISEEVAKRFPGAAIQRVVLLQYGDDPAVEPGQVVVQVTVASAAEAEGDEVPLGAFHRAQADALRQLQVDIGARWPQANRFMFITGQGDGRKFMWRAPVPDEAPGELTPVMARLGPADLETLDTLITAGFAANRAQAVRWALARIRERPAFAKLTEWVRGLDELKAQF